jgi:Thiolase, N-terminal domain
MRSWQTAPEKQIWSIKMKGRDPDTTLERLSQLRPAFTANGTVTAGNSSGINDGAAALVLMSRSASVDRGIEILATIRSLGTCGVDPAVMGMGPVPGGQHRAETSQLESRRYRSGRGQRSVRCPIVSGDQRAALGPK